MPKHSKASMLDIEKKGKRIQHPGLDTIENNWKPKHPNMLNYMYATCANLNTNGGECCVFKFNHAQTFLIYVLFLVHPRDHTSND